jgi:hypothetical protein
MSKRLHYLVVRVLDEATRTTGDLASEAGYHHVTLAKYRAGARRATPAAALAIVESERAHIARLSTLLDRLENLARAERKEG